MDVVNCVWWRHDIFVMVLLLFVSKLVVWYDNLRSLLFRDM